MRKTVLTLLSAICTTVAMAQIPANGLTAHYPLDGNGNDLSGNSYNATTITATPTEDRFGNPNGAYHFDGTQFIEVPQTTPFNTPLVTVSAWVKTTQAPGYYKSVVGIAHNSNGFAWGLLINNGQPSIYTGNEATGAAINDGNWHHLVGVIGATSHDLYVDGLLVQTTPGGAGINATGLLQIGRFRNSQGTYDDNYYEGDIDEVVIYNRALTPSEIFHIYEPCVATTSNNPQTICAGGSYTINGNTYTLEDTYTDILVNADGCDSIVTTVLTVNPLPVVEVSASPQSICEGNSTMLTATGANTYQWDNGLSAGDSHTVSPSQTITYTAFGVDGNGCEASAAVTVTVNTLPIVEVSASPQTICEGSSTVLTATGADTYQWDNGLSAGDQHTVSPSQTTTYTALGVDGNGCEASAAVTVEVQTCVGIAENAAQDAVNIFPNPAASLVTIGNIPNGSTLHILDATGRTVHRSLCPDTQLTVDIQGLVNGMYLILLENNRIVIRRKLTVGR